MARDVGLLAFLAVDAALEGDRARRRRRRRRSAARRCVFLGAAARLPRADRASTRTCAPGRGARPRGRREPAATLALLVAVGIGMHNLGEGLAIGSAYAIGALALGAFLVVGFAIHNTTEGLAIVAPLAGARPGARRLALLGLIAGRARRSSAPGSAPSPSTRRSPRSCSALGVGAIVQVIVQLAPDAARRRRARAHPRARRRASLAGAGRSCTSTGLLVAV